MAAMQTVITVATRGRESRDITHEVNRVVGQSGVSAGLVNVFVQHTSCGVAIMENADADVRRDLEMLLSRWAPDADPAYLHTLEGRDDMAAHARSLLTGNSLTVPVAGGRMLLGIWQGIYLFEHRTAPHQRHIVVTVMD